MKFRITLKDIISGDTRTFEEEYEQDVYPDYPYEYVEYLWEKGNYSCDCNRSIFLWPDNEGKHLECSNNLIKLIELTPLERGKE